MGSNVQKMREALEAWLKACDDFIAKPRSGKWPKNPCGTVVIPLINAAYLFEMTKSALSAPLRNCDVGTVEEQDARFVTWRYSKPIRTELGLNALEWAQMPYEADAEKKGGEA